jgi:hypothetical protein
MTRKEPHHLQVRLYTHGQKVGELSNLKYRNCSLESGLPLHHKDDVSGLMAFKLKPLSSPLNESPH